MSLTFWVPGAAPERLGEWPTECRPDERHVNRIARLRRKIGPDPGQPGVIRTVRGEGYVYDPGCPGIRRLGTRHAVEAATEADRHMAEIELLTADFYRVPVARDAYRQHPWRDARLELDTSACATSMARRAGYTFAVAATAPRSPRHLSARLPELLIGEDADRVEHLWQKLWWALHYGGRGGPTVLALSAVDMALWDLKAKRAGSALWRLLGGHDPIVPCYAGGIDLLLPLDQLLRQTDRQSRARIPGDQDEGRAAGLAEDVERVAAMRRHLGDGFPLMLDANMRWTADQAVRAARAFAPHRSGLAGGAGRSGGPDRLRPRRRGGRPPRRIRREPAKPLGLPRSDHAGQG